MRVPPGVCRRLAPAIVVLLSAFSFACDHLAAGQTLWVRLLEPVSSYSSKAGDPVHAVLAEDLTCDGSVVIPVGTAIDGEVRSVRKVGWGFRHETAALDLAFRRARVSAQTTVPITATLVEVENAREQVSKGVVQGIRSSNSPQGMISSRYKYLPTLNPYPDAGLLIFKATFPIFPEPEIYFPVGTELRLKLTQPIDVLATLRPVEPVASDPAEEYEDGQLARSAPHRSTTQMMVDADIVNIIFVGSRQQVESAFYSAGWTTSEPYDRHSFLRNFYAFLNNSAYAQAPMRPFLLNGKTPDMYWQKSLNSYAKRDHLRMWQWSETNESDKQTIWLSSSTHDASASLSLKYRQFVHHITPDIDEERSKVLRDLKLAGCVSQITLVPRPGFANITQNATGDPVRTDGNLAVVRLQSCSTSDPEVPVDGASANFKAGNKTFRYFRRTILTFRSDIWRANIIYGAYDVGHMGFEAMRQRHTAATFTGQPAIPASSIPVVQTFR